MSYGLLTENGVLEPISIQCTAEVTDDFGLFRLVHIYQAGAADAGAAYYVFPVTNAMRIVSFDALVGGRALTSKVVPKEGTDEPAASRFYTGGLEVPLGRLHAGDEIRIELCYAQRCTADAERTRIIIPTGIAPRFMDFGAQIALESFFEDHEYRVQLKLTYRNYNIKNVVSPTHAIGAVYGENCVEVFLKDELCSDKDIIIDVFSVHDHEPRVMRYEDCICCSFIPEMDVYRRRQRDYLFLIDISADINTRKLQQIKSAVLLCIRALQNGDRFNICFAQSENMFFVNEFVPLNDDTLRAATRWVVSYAPKGAPEFYRPLQMAYRMLEKETTVMFISDGRTAGNETILQCVRENRGLRFYCFGFDLATTQDFLDTLAGMTGGKSRMIGHTERIDDTVVRAFNVIVAPSVRGAVIRFDTSVSEVTPGGFHKIHCGERVTVMARFMEQPPAVLYLKGSLGGTESVIQVKLDRVLEGGPELLYRFGYESISNLQEELCRADACRRQLIKRKIADISVHYGIHSRYTAFEVTDSLERTSVLCDVERRHTRSSGWYEPTLAQHDTPLTRSREDIQFTEIAKRQRANGRFIPSESRSREAIALYTAKVVRKFLNECQNAELYRWHMRKAIAFLLDHIEQSEYAEIPEELIGALSDWLRLFGSTDEISQKASVLEYLHRKN